MFSFISKYFKKNRILNFLNLTKTPDEMNHTKEPVFQKVKCYDVNKKCTLNKVTIEKENPKMIKLTENQKRFLINYINKCLFDYNTGKIHLCNELIQKFKNVQHAIENDLTISKYCVDYILADYKKSFIKHGNDLKIEEIDDLL
jgi:hypothetical protein